MKFIATLLLTAVALISLNACNTVKGFGADMQQGGQALERAAKNR